MKALGITRKVVALINRINDKLPVVMEHTHEQHFVRGAQLIESGRTHDERGIKIIPEVMYLENFPVMIAINHKHRLKNAYKNKGLDGITEYIDWVTELVKSQL